MKTIEINTSFNVIIKFNLASVYERGVAYFIDMAIVWTAIGLLTALFSALISNPSNYLVLFIAAPIMGSYTILSEVLSNGQTIGKKAMKMQVVRIDGKRTQPSDFFMRWIFRLIDIYSSGFILGIITITASLKGQRIGDVLADTCVIRIKERPETSLKAITDLDKLQKVEPKFPEVIKLTEREMMLVKETLDRVKKYPNQAHQNAINELIKKLEDELQIKCKIKQVDFLNQLIKDFVILTR